MLGTLILVGALASALLASRIVEAQRNRPAVEEALVAIPVETPDDRGRH